MAKLSVTFDANTKALQAGVAQSKKSVGGLNASFAKFGKIGAGAVAGVAVGLAAATVAAGALFLRMAKLGEIKGTEEARLTNAVKVMGLFGDKTDEVAEKLIAFGDEQNVKLGVSGFAEIQAKLLTFGNVAQSADQAGSAFERATLAAYDLAAAGFGTASANAVQLGKALQDPIKGLGALAKSGVTFTSQEREKIKVLVESGKTMEAQSMILDALEKQVGGAAIATANGTDKIRSGWNLVMQTLGKPFAEVMDNLSNKFAELMPQILEMINGIVPHIKAFGTVLTSALEDSFKGDNTKIAALGEFLGDMFVAGFQFALKGLWRGAGNEVLKLATYFIPDEAQGEKMRKSMDGKRDELVQFERQEIMSGVVSKYNNLTGNVSAPLTAAQQFGKAANNDTLEKNIIEMNNYLKQSVRYQQTMAEGYNSI